MAGELALTGWNDKQPYKVQLSVAVKTDSRRGLDAFAMVGMNSILVVDSSIV